MSAFMCSENHIGALVRYWVQNDRYGRFREIQLREAEVTHWREIYASLAGENVKSLNARYGSNTAEYFGIADGDDPDATTPTKPRPSCYPVLLPVTAIKLAQCFEYQACEHDGWEKSEAAAIIRQIINTAIHQLPGYDAAPWGI